MLELYALPQLPPQTIFQQDCRHFSASMLGITWTNIWLVDESA
jgi:hypothetical protein